MLPLVPFLAGDPQIGAGDYDAMEVVKDGVITVDESQTLPISTLSRVCSSTSGLYLPYFATEQDNLRPLSCRIPFC